MRIDPYKPLPAGFQPRVAGAGPSRLTPPLPHNDDCEDIQDIQDDVAHAAAPLRSGACDEALNSEDELDQPTMHHTEQAELERHFEEKLHARGLRIRRMEQDGNCLFRAVSDRVYGDADMHDVVRRLCLDHIEKERDHFSQYVTQDFDAYVRRKRHTWQGLGVAEGAAQKGPKVMDISR